jgi:hypothetical protein
VAADVKEKAKPTSSDPKACLFFLGHARACLGPEAMTFTLQVNDALRKFSLDTVLGGLSTQKQTITVGSTINEELNDSGRHDVSFLGCVACICAAHLQKSCKFAKMVFLHQYVMP